MGHIIRIKNLQQPFLYLLSGLLLSLETRTKEEMRETEIDWLDKETWIVS